MKKQLVLALALAAAPFAAMADGHSYSYVEGGYAQLNQELPDVDDAQIDDIEAAGFFIAGSAELGESFHLFGAYRSGDDDVGVTIPGLGSGSVGVDMSQYQIGLGYHSSVGTRTDLVAEVSALGTEIDVQDDGAEAMEGDDFRLSVGVRHLIADPVEVWVKANYTDGDAFDSAGSVSAGLQYKFTQTWGLVGEVEAGSEFSLFGVGVRASF
ncbi:outer membrane beta-barrel protein [Lysobacter sp. LF1]|uniref:Outer membrane beta-barrel protein n=1 Tax=Lysobacter stagni TaxID=3045172 RepID=A0ABT6XCS8_9GAMM|nr:outer membrane beta-barrel protein [Lysobacter sp. LF1]MDI9237945.1 outer membrane beta-barrel protein [Lysobacter sp. LF1]